jgi:hypothetical protein
MFSYIIIMNCSSFANFCVLPVFCFLLVFFWGGVCFCFCILSLESYMLLIFSVFVLYLLLCFSTFSIVPPMFLVSLDFPFLVSLSVFSNVYLALRRR